MSVNLTELGVVKSTGVEFPLFDSKNKDRSQRVIHETINKQVLLNEQDTLYFQ